MNCGVAKMGWNQHVPRLLEDHGSQLWKKVMAFGPSLAGSHIINDLYLVSCSTWMNQGD